MASENFVTDQSIRVLIHRFSRENWTNFSRTLVSLEPPYFHTQGGLQKYVGGATSDVTCVRGLAQRQRATVQRKHLFLSRMLHLNCYYIWFNRTRWRAWMHFKCSFFFFLPAQRIRDIRITPICRVNNWFCIFKSFQTGKYFMNAVFKDTHRGPKNTFIAYKYFCVTSC